MSIVAVTYGNRVDFLSAVVRQVLADDLKPLVSELIVVDNASAASTKAFLSGLAAVDNRVKLICHEDNVGSASGYRSGLQLAIEGTAEFVLLLDDDNLPCPSAIPGLVAAQRRIEAADGSVQVVLFCARWSHQYHRRLVRGEDPSRVFPRRSSYCAFHFLDLPLKVFRALRRAKSVTEENAPCNTQVVEVPYGPYGGLFMRRELLPRIGYPNEEYFVYADDFEYTHRMAAAGLKLLLVPTCRISDIDESWSNDSKERSVLRSIFRNQSSDRVYLSLRNQVYFEKVLNRNPIVYALNRLLFKLLLVAGAVRFGNWSRLQLVLVALRHGEEGRLGRPEWTTL